MTRTLVSLAVLVSLAPGRPAAAQESARGDEMKFVEQLRERGLPDLALEYLEKRIGPDPRYANELPLEIALARLDMANVEPDAVKRLALFDRTRAELAAFLQNNATHARAGEARFQLAHVTSLQGKTQLGRALSLPAGDDARAEFLKARKLLEEAAKEVRATAAQINTEQARNRAEVELGQLLLAQARTFDKGNDKEVEARSKVLKQAIDLLEKVAKKLDEKDALAGVALAWAGRGYSMNFEPNEAKKKFAAVKSGDYAGALRLVRYFELLGEHDLMEEKTATREDVARVIDRGRDWLRDYYAHRGTPEGLGVQYVLAAQYAKLGDLTANAQEKNTYYNAARRLARDVEHTDNEFSIRAQEVKVGILLRQNAFSRPLGTLTSFDDFYMRGLYEHSLLAKGGDDKKFEKEEDRKKQQQKVVDALTRAVALATQRRAETIPEVDLANAHHLLTGYHLAMKNDREAAKVGEAFARAHPRAKYASTVATFAAQALSKRAREGGDDWNKTADERERLYQFGAFMDRTWPAEKAGAFGRYLIVDYLLKKPLTAQDRDGQKAERLGREKEALARARDFARFEIARRRLAEREPLEAVHLLRPVKPDFDQYGLALYQLAVAALQVHDDNVQRERTGQPPVLLAPGDKRSFREVAVEALEKVPEPAADDEPEANLNYLRAKILLGFQYYPLKRFDPMQALVNKLEPQLDALPLPPGVNKDELRPSLFQVQLYALYGKADAEYQAGRYAEVAKLLDPLVKDLGRKKAADLKADPRLVTGLMGLAFRGNLQAERLAAAKAVIDTWKKLEENNKELVPNVLKQTVATLKRQVDELRRKKDHDKLTRTVNGFAAFLDDVAKSEAAPSADSLVLLAQGYLSVGKNDKALALLEKVAEPGAGADPRAVGLYRLAQVLRARAHRLAGKENNHEAEYRKADALLKQSFGDDGKGWGARDINARKEQIYLYLDRGYHGAAVNRANDLVKILLPKVREGASFKDHYFEVYYLFVCGYLKYGLAQQSAAEREPWVKKAAQSLHALAENYPDLGGEESKERFRDLLASEEGAFLRDELKKSHNWELKD